MIDPVSIASYALGAAKTLAASAATAGATAAVGAATDPKAKAKAAAEDFESVLLGTMFSQMFTETEGEGPMGGGAGTGIWRSFLTDEYAKSFSKAGGIGLSSDIARSLLAVQEAKQK